MTTVRRFSIPAHSDQPDFIAEHDCILPRTSTPLSESAFPLLSPSVPAPATSARLALRRQIDAFAWDLVFRTLAPLATLVDEAEPEIPLDSEDRSR